MRKKLLALCIVTSIGLYGCSTESATTSTAAPLIITENETTEATTAVSATTATPVADLTVEEQTASDLMDAILNEDFDEMLHLLELDGENSTVTANDLKDAFSNTDLIKYRDEEYQHYKREVTTISDIAGNIDVRVRFIKENYNEDSGLTGEEPISAEHFYFVPDENGTSHIDLSQSIFKDMFYMDGDIKIPSGFNIAINGYNFTDNGTVGDDGYVYYHLDEFSKGTIEIIATNDTGTVIATMEGHDISILPSDTPYEITLTASEETEEAIKESLIKIHTDVTALLIASAGQPIAEDQLEPYFYIDREDMQDLTELLKANGLNGRFNAFQCSNITITDLEFPEIYNNNINLFYKNGHKVRVFVNYAVDFDDATGHHTMKTTTELDMVYDDGTWKIATIGGTTEGGVYFLTHLSAYLQEW